VRKYNGTMMQNGFVSIAVLRLPRNNCSKALVKLQKGHLKLNNSSKMQKWGK